MRKLIINADDFGFHHGVNQGILEAHTGGVVTSTSLMVLAPAAEQAAAAARAHRELSVGLHFVEEQNADLDDPEQAERAFASQLTRFRELIGKDPTHVDSHHHVHTDPHRMATFARLVEPLGIPLRGDGRVRYIGGFYGQWAPGVTELDYLRRPFLLELVTNEALDGFSELACHPARLERGFSSSYLRERAVELETLTEPGLGDEIEARGVSLVSFHAWPRAEQPSRL